MRLIDAVALKKVIPDTWVDIFENCRNCTLLSSDEVIDIINDAPTVEASPVRHGHWVEMERGHYFKCSICRNPIPYKFGWKLYNNVIQNKRYYNYCPNCGAKMDEVSE